MVGGLSGLVILAVVTLGWIQVLDFIGHPGRPQDDLLVSLRVEDDDLVNGTYRLTLLATAEAIAAATTPPEIELFLPSQVDNGVHAVLGTPDGPRATVTPNPDWSGSQDQLAAGCDDGDCLREFDLIIEGVTPATSAFVGVAVTIEYQPLQDGVSDEAGLVLMLKTPSGTSLTTAGNGAPTLLTADGETHVTRQFTLEIPRGQIPDHEVDEDGTVEAIWREGVVAGVVASGATATVALEAADRVVVPIAGPQYVRGSGHARWPFSLPLELTCEQTVCHGTWQTTFDLNTGDWALFDWSNNLGLQARDGTPLPGWTISTSK